MPDLHDREELLDAIEAANDELAEVVEIANTHVKGGRNIRPTAALVFGRLEDAHHTLCEVDPTRDSPGDTDD